jgi:hypothetical protein
MGSKAAQANPLALDQVNDALHVDVLDNTNLQTHGCTARVPKQQLNTPNYLTMYGQYPSHGQVLTPLNSHSYAEPNMQS